jgi:hypothetical protein
VIANPCPGGAFFGSRIGKNTSSNSAINGDNYPRLTYYIAYTLNSAMGIQVGRCKRRRSARRARESHHVPFEHAEQQHDRRRQQPDQAGVFGDLGRQQQPFRSSGAGL